MGVVQNFSVFCGKTGGHLQFITCVCLVKSNRHLPILQVFKIEHS